MVEAVPMQDNCRIEYHMQNGLTQLDALVTSPRIAHGSYQFEVISVTDAGRSANAQSGAFDLDRTLPQRLSATTVSGGKNQWSAELRVYDPGGNLVCRTILPEK